MMLKSMMVFTWIMWMFVAEAASSAAPTQSSNCNVYNVQSLRQHPACCLNVSSSADLINQVAKLQVAMEKFQSEVPAMRVKISNLQKQVALMGAGRLPGTCDDALINGTKYRVEDRQLSSASISENSSPARSRLHTQKGPGQMYGAWRPLSTSYPWLEVDFERLMQVTAIGTQGADQLRQWVKTYYIKYSDDSVLWRSYVTGTGRQLYVEDYPGNTDSHTVMKNRITFKARYVRIIPRNYQTFPALRWEIYGCPA